MHRPGSSQLQMTQASLEQVPLMLQTEDRFTSLPHAVSAALAMYGLRSNHDAVGALTGDAFAVQVFPEKGCERLADRAELLHSALADVGMSVNRVGDEVGPDNRMRVFAIMRAGLTNVRPSLVCGGWETTGESAELRWGIINRMHPTEPLFLGDTMEAPFLDAPAAQDIPWPQEGSRTSAVLLLAQWRDPQSTEAALSRRALQRGLSLLAGDQGFGGPGEHSRLLELLTGSDSLYDDPAAASYPYPALLFARCRFEAMARYLGGVCRVVPRRKRAPCRNAMELAAASGQILLNAEPLRAHRRSHRAAVDAGTVPWPLDAWRQRARALDAPDTEARRREVALIEQLRELHVALVESLDTLLAKV